MSWEVCIGLGCRRAARLYTSAQNNRLPVTGTGSISKQSPTRDTLQPFSSTLNDTIVIGYGTQKRKDLTGSLSVVTAKDFQGAQITTPEQLIAGKGAGASITSNAASPAAGSLIRIRGVS